VLTRAELSTPGAALLLSHPVGLYLSTLARGSRRAQAAGLRTVARFYRSRPLELAWEALGPAELAAVRAWLAERYAPATTNRTLAAVRGVLRACRTLRTLTRDELEELEAALRNVKGARTLRGRALEPGELERLFAALELGAQGARDGAILALLYGCGLRRAELEALELEHVRGQALRVRGKGNQERIVPMPATVAERLEAWLEVRGRETGPLFLRRGGGRLGAMAVYQRIGRLAARAGLERLSPHDLRRAYVGDLLDRRVDLATVQQLCGHADPQTTARYDRRPARARARAVQVLSVPSSSASSPRFLELPE